MPAFALATLLPLPLIALGASFGGVWVWLALGWLTVLTATLDILVRRSLPPGDAREFPLADGLSILLALGHLGLLALVVHALGADDLTSLEKAGVFAATGLCLGQIGNANAHELIHRTGRGLRGLGIAVYVALLYGHHASAHTLVHHVRVATRDDPATARLGESFYRYAWRAWRGSFREGWRAESARAARIARPILRHPYGLYLGGAALMLALAMALGGVKGMVLYLLLAGFAQAQLLMSDYVQHYGLIRRARPDGRPEPVGARHCWNAAHPASSAMMLNAPRHSDHHAHPARPYPALTLPKDAPTLPHSLPVMACIALWPRLWRQVMDGRATLWCARLTEG